MARNDRWRDEFKAGEELMLSSCSRAGRPHANIVLSLGFVDGKLLVADCQMRTTIRNLRENPHIVVISEYLRLHGKVRIFRSGKYFDLCVRKSKGYEVKNAIVISVDTVCDLDEGKMLYRQRAS